MKIQGVSFPILVDINIGKLTILNYHLYKYLMKVQGVSLLFYSYSYVQAYYSKLSSIYK